MKKGLASPLPPFRIEYRRSLADGFVYVSLYPVGVGGVCISRAGSNDKKVIDFGVWCRCFDPGDGLVDNQPQTGKEAAKNGD